MRATHLILGQSRVVVDGREGILMPGFAMFFAKAFPSGTPFAISYGLVFPWADKRRVYTVSLDVLNEQDKSILTMPPHSLSSQIVIAPEEAEFQHEELHLTKTVQLPDIQFPGPGFYSVVLIGEGKELARTQLRAAPLSRSRAARALGLA